MRLYHITIDGITEWSHANGEHAYEVYRSFCQTRPNAEVALFDPNGKREAIRRASLSNGIDYGLGQTNVDRETGIRYGVISSHAILQAWVDSAEANYGKPHCPKCGNDCLTSDTIDDVAITGADWFDGKDFTCTTCEHCFSSDQAYPDEALSYSYDADGYKAEDCLDSDVIVTKSEFYTYGPYCSPCVPGAVSLPEDSENAERYDRSGIKAYCFGHDWFDDGKAPYKVYRVADDSEVLS